MKKLAVLVVAIMILGLQASAATVVLKGGKQLQVESYTSKGSVVLVHYADGRVESYPVSAVDLTATASANAAPKATPGPKAAVGPQSPFADAMAPAGAPGLVVTDQDVGHFQKGEPGSEQEGDKEAKSGAHGRVVLLNYQKNPAGDNTWDIVATVVNQGDAPVQAVSATIMAVDDQGKPVGSAPASLKDRLEPGQQAAMTARLTVTGPISTLSFDLSWQAIVPAPAKATPAVPGQAPAAAAQPSAAPPAMPTPSSPLSVVNPMDSSQLTNAPSPPAQIPR